LQGTKFTQQFDLDGNGLVNFDEFLLFQTLLSIPLDDLEVAFRLMDRGEVGGCRLEWLALLPPPLVSFAASYRPLLPPSLVSGVSMDWLALGWTPHHPNPNLNLPPSAPPRCSRPTCVPADGSGKVDRAEFSALLDSLHAQAGKPSVSMRKSVHTSE
jgi:hypothetical protein